MTIQPNPDAFALDQQLVAHENQSLLRFITCGSVDDGKSTLIGRLLYETKGLFDDQLATLQRESQRIGTQRGALDFSLLLDGLAAEREQGITIDVAYRYFATPRRTFIVADTPGHEQYTRNMATGASTADLAILLVDARKGITRQTRRHSTLVAMLGIRHVVIAVNKMDLVGWSRETFDAIMADYRASLGGTGVVGIPLSALHGDNIIAASENAPWYHGPTLLQHLESVDIDHDDAPGGFAMPVQWVNRPDAEFRGFSGFITSGSIKPGAAVQVLPSGRTTSVSRIVTFRGDLAEAVAGQSVTLVLADEIDISRGDVIASLEGGPAIADRLVTRLFWASERALAPGDHFLLKLGAQTVPATVTAIVARLDIETGRSAPSATLEMNDIGEVVITLSRPACFAPYAVNRDAGGFILIDRESFNTAALGLVVSEADGPVRRNAALADAMQWLRTSAEHPVRSIAKVASWRVIGSATTMLVAYAITGDLRVSAAIGAAEIIAKMVLSYGHERLWSRIRFGARRVAS